MARLLNVLSALALAFLAAGDVAQAQTCDTLLGKADCGGPGGGVTSAGGARSNSASGPTGFSTQALGRGLSVTDDDQTGMFGAITFGGRGTTCSGPFRVRSC